MAGWPEGAEMHYAPKWRLNLKLFSFMGASRLDSRHETHRQHYRELLSHLRANTRVLDSGAEDDVLRTLENLLLGFQGAGSGRTWCAQSFLPICPGTLAGETIWNETVARRRRPSDWDSVVGELKTYFSTDKHKFLARGGEVLYLQVCNSPPTEARSDPSMVAGQRSTDRPGGARPDCLHAGLQRELGRLMEHCRRPSRRSLSSSITAWSRIPQGQPIRWMARGASSMQVGVRQRAGLKAIFSQSICCACAGLT